LKLELPLDESLDILSRQHPQLPRAGAKGKVSQTTLPGVQPEPLPAAADRNQPRGRVAPGLLGDVILSASNRLALDLLTG